MSDTLGLVTLGSAAYYPIGKLKEKLSQLLEDFRVQILRPLDAPTMAYDSFRKQYHSTRILALLEEYAETVQTEYVLGIASGDLYVPGMNFVFGEARCPGRVAVISTFRLRSRRLDKPGVFDSRVVKEAVHETGHMLGLEHCRSASCVMHFSEQLADTDRKEEKFCSECESKLELIEVE
jgi:archaemetzincin